MKHKTGGLENSSPVPLDDITLAVFAGGKSRRMGSDKAFLKLSGLTLIERALENGGKVFEKVVISAPLTPEYKAQGVPIIPDITPGEGPLVGLLSVLEKIETEKVFVMACDMPCVSEGMMRLIVSSSHGFSIVVTRNKRGQFEPLLGVYAKSIKGEVRSLIDSGERRIAPLFSLPCVRIIEEDQWRKTDPEGKSFLNINTPEDTEAIERLL